MSQTAEYSTLKHVFSYAPQALSGIPVIVIPALEVLPGISDFWRTWAILISLLLAFIGIVWNLKEKRFLSEEREINEDLRRRLAETSAEDLLHSVSDVLFRDGAWRLSVFRRVLVDGSSDRTCLELISTVSSDRVYQNLVSSQIPLGDNELFCQVFDENTRQPRNVRPLESGGFEGDVHSVEWETWVDAIFGKGCSIPVSSSFHPRKYVFFASVDRIEGSTLVVIAESTKVDGVSVDLLNGSFTPVWSSFAAHLERSRVTESKDSDTEAS